MKTTILPFPLLTSATLAILISLGSARAEILLEDNFTSSASGASTQAEVDGRQPAKGPVWEGTAKVEEGAGLVANEAAPNSVAFADVSVPPEFKKLIVKIRYRRGSEQQFAFGFANSDKALRDSKGKNNLGIMWVNTMGKRANMLAGKYSNGAKVEGIIIAPSAKDGGMMELQFEVENPGSGAWLARLMANENDLAAKELQPSETPTYRYFFMQFRGDDGKSSNAIVENVSVEIQ